MALGRHRGVFKVGDPSPYELSRTRIENFVRCRGCFWLQQLKGVKPPEIPSFTLNTTTDILLKRDADRVRGKSSLPIWEKAGLGHLVPFSHEDLENWTNSLQFGLNDRYFNVVHRPTNLKVGGGLDDVFVDSHTGVLHIVDYKSTAQGTRSPERYQKKPVSIDDPWKAGYKRQMDLYVWVMRQKGFEVSDTGFFLYVDAQHKGVKGMLSSEAPAKAFLEFDASIIPYSADTSWVEPTLFEIRELLENQSAFPGHTPENPEIPYSGCDVGRYAKEMMEALNVTRDAERG